MQENAPWPLISLFALHRGSSRLAKIAKIDYRKKMVQAIRQPNSQLYNFFLTLILEDTAAEQISEIQAAQSGKHSLKSVPRPRETFHVTLHFLGTVPELPVDILHAVRQACESTCRLVSALDVEFSRVLSFRGQPGKQPLVLTDEKNNAALAAFHYVLGTELKSRGIPIKRSFTPHVTLFYTKDIGSECVRPVQWRVSDFALVSSFIGKTYHKVMERWKLRNDNGAGTLEKFASKIPPSGTTQLELPLF